MECKITDIRRSKVPLRYMRVEGKDLEPTIRASVDTYFDRARENMFCANGITFQIPNHVVRLQSLVWTVKRLLSNEIDTVFFDYNFLDYALDNRVAFLEESSNLLTHYSEIPCLVVDDIKPAQVSRPVHFLFELRRRINLTTFYGVSGDDPKLETLYHNQPYFVSNTLIQYLE